MTIPWFRISLDLDHDGNWRGLSIEARVADRIETILVLEEPGPFESGPEMLERATDDIFERYGIQLRLL